MIGDIHTLQSYSFDQRSDFFEVDGPTDDSNAMLFRAAEAISSLLKDQGISVVWQNAINTDRESPGFNPDGRIGFFRALALTDPKTE